MNGNMASQRNWGFCDLSVSNNYEFDKLDVLEKLGFHTIAINTHVDEPGEEPKKKKRKGEIKEKQDYIPAPLNMPNQMPNNIKLNILQRVTIEFSDSSISHKFNQSENLKKYDLIAVVPKTLQAFQFACSSLDVDIISFDPEGKIPFKMTRKLYRQAVERGIFFEIMYSPAIRDSTARKNIISTAHMYHAIGKSKNIIITSGAENNMQVRDVHDIINLGFIFGLNSNQSLDVIRNNTRKAIIKAEGRRYGKLYMTVNLNETNIENKTSES